MQYHTYILECSDRTLYTGWTTDIEKRVITHNTLKTGAKYTSMRRPVKLVYSESFETRSEAMKRECVVKKMTRKEKQILLKTYTTKPQKTLSKKP